MQRAIDEEHKLMLVLIFRHHIFPVMSVFISHSWWTHGRCVLGIRSHICMQQS
jgi:hypothetical protein